MNEITVNQLNDLVIQSEIESADRYAKNALTEKTAEDYRRSWERFEVWCMLRDFRSMPATPDTVKVFIGWMADNGKKVSTITKMLSTISKAHKTLNQESPTKSEIVQDAYKGIRRTLGVEQAQVDPVTPDQIHKICDSFDDSDEGIRNRAIILTGFMGGFRRSEIVKLLKRDAKFENEGVKIKLQRSKTDQEGVGITKAIVKDENRKYCAVAALTDWLIVAPDSKFLFCHIEGARGKKSSPGMRMSDRMIARLLQKWSNDLGIEGWFAGHSLRAGFVTAAAKAGKSDRSIMKITGHKSHAMIDRYVRDANLFEDNAGKGLL